MGDTLSLDDLNQAFVPQVPSNDYVPVSSGGGVTVSVPKHADGIGLDQLNDDFKQLDAKKPSVPTAGTASRLDTDFENQMLASSQFVTPDVKSHKPNYVGDAQENDAGEIGYKDEKGNFQPTDSNKHVILKDPDDGNYKIFNRTDDTSAGPITGRLLGLGRFLGQGFATGAPETAASVPDVAGAAIRQGVQLPKAVGTPGAASFVSKVPLANIPLTRSAGTAIDQIGTAADRAATIPTGATIAPEQAGETARAAINAYAAPKTGALADRVNQAYDNVKSSFTDPNVTHEPGNAKAYAAQLTQKYANAGMSPPKTLNSDIMGAINKPGGLDYDSMKLVRQKVGEMIENPGLLAEGTSPSELKGLYGSLSEDLKDVVSKAGGGIGTPGGDKALSVFNRANTYNRLVNQRRETLQRVLGPDSRSDEGLFGTIMKMAGSTNSADAKTLATARKAVGEAGWQDVAGAAVNQLGRQVTKANPTGEFTPSNFARDYNKLSEAGKNTLFGSPGYTELRKALDDINLLSTETGGKLEKLAHPAGLAHTGLGWFGVYEAINAMKDAVFGGSMLEAGGVGASLVGAAGISKWLSTPLKARNAARWLGAYQRYKNSPGNPAALAGLNNATQTFKDAAQDRQETDGQ